MKYTFIWQSRSFADRDWIPRLFEGYVDNEVYDVAEGEIYEGLHSVALDNSILIDSYLQIRPREYYQRFRGLNAFLFHTCDETYEGGYEAYENFRGVFRIHGSKLFYNPRRIYTFPRGYSSDFQPSVTYPDAASRPYLWSFLGGATKCTRPEMARAMTRVTPNYFLNTDLPNSLRLNKREYEATLRDSVFAPSPMGNINIECFRTYEALESGTIPILERRLTIDCYKDTLGPHPMPTFTSWSKAADFVLKISKDKTALNALQSECMSWWREHKQRVHAEVGIFLSTPHTAADGPYIRSWYRIPGAQVGELLRHHSLPAFARRVHLQFSRLFKEGKLRKTTGA